MKIEFYFLFIAMTSITNYITIILYFSNYLVIPLLIKLYSKGEYFGFILALCGGFFSALYHASEIKFKLEPMLYWPKNEVMILLNLDRLFALCSITYFILRYNWYPYKYWIIIALAFNGGSELIGRAGYLKLYCITHLIWHCLAYYIGYQIC